jgi:hypothetical protein
MVFAGVSSLIVLQRSVFFLIELKGVKFFYWFKCKMINDTVLKKLSFLEVYEWE